MMKFLLCLVMLIAAASADLAKLIKVQEPIGGLYIVVLKDETNLDQFISSMEVGALTQGTQTKVMHKFGHVLNGFSVRIPDTFVNWLRSLEGIDYIEESGIVRPATDQRNPPSWGQDRVNQQDLPLDNLYTYGFCGEGINVYIIDTGIRYTHNEFGGRAYPFWSYDGNNGEDCNGHGTHCSGTITGSSYGLAKCVNIYNAKVFPCSGGASVDIIIAAMDKIRADGTTPAVVSMSLGGGASYAEDRALKALYDAGFVVSVAAGNDNADACNYSPAGAPEAITVGATDRYDVRSSFSNYGTCLDLFAPGSSITSAWYRSDSDSLTISGTSMACPHVTGAAAKLLEQQPYTPKDVAEILVRDSTEDRLSNIGTGSPNILLYTY